MSTDISSLMGNTDPNHVPSLPLQANRGVRNTGAPLGAQANLYQVVESFKIKTSFSSACSRGPAPKWQVAKELPSGYMAIAHTGESHSPGMGETSQDPSTLCLS